MKLCRITVDGFRNIKKTDIVCEEMVALVSLNSFGKSNLLGAIDFGVDFIYKDEETKLRMMSWSPAIPLNKSMVSRDFCIEFEMSTEIAGKTHSIIYGYKFRWKRDDESGNRIVAEWLKTRLNEKKQKYNILINRENDKAFYRSSLTGRCSTKIAIDSTDLIINKLKAFETLYYYEFVKKINSLRVYIERHLDASSSYSPDPIIRKGARVLEMEGLTNLPRAIFHLKKQYPAKYELLINAYMQLFPQIAEIYVEELSIKDQLKEKFPEDLPFKLSNEVYVLYVTDVNLNQPINFENMSDGAKRVFLLLTNLIAADINKLSLIAVEEPENSIHPSLLQSYLRVLSQLLGETKIIVTSHSPYIIQYLEPRNIYVGLPSRDGVAQFKKVRASAQKMLIDDAADSEMSTGDYLFDLMSGTPDDLETLDQYLEYSKDV